VERVAGAKPKFPKLLLPKFSGDVTKFKSFWDSFDSAIHKNPDFSLIDKFNYLRALLDGPAATTIQLSEANYTAAVELIQERFDKTREGNSHDRRCVYCKADHYSASFQKISEPVKHKKVLGMDTVSVNVVHRDAVETVGKNTISGCVSQPLIAMTRVQRCPLMIVVRMSLSITFQEVSPADCSYLCLPMRN